MKGPKRWKVHSKGSVSIPIHIFNISPFQNHHNDATQVKGLKKHHKRNKKSINKKKLWKKSIKKDLERISQKNSRHRDRKSEFEERNSAQVKSALEEGEFIRVK